MNRILKHIGIFVSLLLLLIACGPSAVDKEKARVRRNKTPNPIVWDTLKINESEILEYEGIKSSCAVDFSYIVTKEYENEEVRACIQTQLDSITIGSENIESDLSTTERVKRYVASYLDTYKKEVESKVKLWGRSDEKIKNILAPHKKNIETEVLYDEANLISYQIRITEFNDETTTSFSLNNLVLDLTNGAVILQNDIFKADTQSALNEIVISQIIKDKEVATIEELQKLGYWGIADLEADENFYVNKDGITFTFSPAEYSDASLGILEVLIDYDDMLEILKKDSPIAILIHDVEE